MYKRILSGVVLLQLVGTSASAQPTLAALNHKLFGPDDSLVTAALARVSASPETRLTRTVGEAEEVETDQARASSFEALQRALEVGQEVKVRDEDGRVTRGKVVSISSDQLVIAQPHVWLPLFRRPEKLAFTEAAVRRIDVVDSPWDKALIVGGVAFGVWAASLAAADSSNPVGLGLGGMLVVPAAFIVAGAIDEYTTEPIYERQSQTPRVTISPLLQRNQAGIRKSIVVHVRF